MSRKYKFHNPSGIYFVSFATIQWVDVFIRQQYFDIMVESLKHGINTKGLELFSWCIMPSHVHMVYRAKDENPGAILGELKSFTSKKLQNTIAENSKESRREWLRKMFLEAGIKNSNVTNGQFWQQHNQPIELWSDHVMKQKIDYTHNNPVVAGFVRQPEHWQYSSAIDYNGGQGLIELESRKYIRVRAGCSHQLTWKKRRRHDPSQRFCLRPYLLFIYIQGYEKVSHHSSNRWHSHCCGLDISLSANESRYRAV